MRRFVADILCERPMGEPPPYELLQVGYLTPIAYRRGFARSKGDYAATLIVADRRARVIREVAATFIARGIELAPIKGAALVGSIYPDPAERPMNDIDALVRVDQLPSAIEAILSLGFERVGFSRKLSNFYHAIVFLRGDIMFELHRNIVQPYRTNLRIADVWARSTIDAATRGIRRLEPIDELLICAVHMARHELAVPAINYVDISRLWKRLSPSDQASARARAEEWRVARAFAAVLAMTENLAHARIGSPDVGAGSSILPTTDDILLGLKPKRARQIAQKLLLAQGTRDRIGLGFVTVAAIVDGWWRARSSV